jgi:hypothetical protein
MLNNPNPLLSKAEWCRYCIHLTSFGLKNIKEVQAMGLKDIATSSAMETPLYKISSKTMNRFKSYLET